MAYARQRGILCQGRGSAANSLVCYLLQITAVDPVRFGLPFERFLSTTRDEEPDIDVDFDSDRREEVIQYVYGRYGRRNAAQVANVITYRPKLAVRDVAKALGYSTGQQDAWSKQVETWGSVATTDEHDIPRPWWRWPSSCWASRGTWASTPAAWCSPTGRWARCARSSTPARSSAPSCSGTRTTARRWAWSSSTCWGWACWRAAVLLRPGRRAHRGALDAGLGAQGGARRLRHALPGRLRRRLPGREPRPDGHPARLQPREFYHLVIDIALIRPGPIQGGAVHPYIRRKLGQEQVTYPHPLLEPVLARTLGIPLFQEQLMQIAVAVGGCTGDDADLLRRAMGSKRGKEKIASLRATLFTGMASHGITGQLAERSTPRSRRSRTSGSPRATRSASRCWSTPPAGSSCTTPAAFLAALLRAQPMGFYSPQTLVADARRHGVQVLTPDVLRSRVHADLEREDPGAPRPTGPAACRAPDQPPTGEFDPHAPFDTADHRLDEGFAVRLGLAGVRSIGEAVAERVVNRPRRRGPFTSLADLVLRTGLTAPQLEALATAGAFDGLGSPAGRRCGRPGGRRRSARPAARVRGGRAAPMLPGMSPAEETMADLWATAISPASHPVQHVRAQLHAAGVLPASGLLTATSGTRVRVGGVVTHRQRPATAGGTTFLNLEDETGLVNVIVSTGCGRGTGGWRGSPRRWWCTGGSSATRAW